MDNFLDSPLGLLIFLSIFHIIGALVLAKSVRGLWSALREKTQAIGSNLFLALWGGMFGCLPFAFGVSIATEDEGTLLVLLGQTLIWGSVFVVALLAWDEVLDWVRPFLHVNFFLIAFGGLFIAIGSGAAVLIIRQDVLFGLLFGGIFMLVGGLILGIGMWRLLRSAD